jgi:hypothetical protein
VNTVSCKGPTWLTVAKFAKDKRAPSWLLKRLSTSSTADSRILVHSGGSIDQVMEKLKLFEFLQEENCESKILDRLKQHVNKGRKLEWVSVYCIVS